MCQFLESAIIFPTLFPISRWRDSQSQFHTQTQQQTASLHGQRNPSQMPSAMLLSWSSVFKSMHISINSLHCFRFVHDSAFLHSQYLPSHQYFCADISLAWYIVNLGYLIKQMINSYSQYVTECVIKRGMSRDQGYPSLSTV